MDRNMKIKPDMRNVGNVRLVGGAAHVAPYNWSFVIACSGHRLRRPQEVITIYRVQAFSGRRRGTACGG